MAKETKAEREAREAAEAAAQEKAAKAAERKAAREAAKNTVQEPQVVIVDFSDDTKNLLRTLVEAINNKPAPVISMPVAAKSTPAPVAAAAPAVQEELFPKEQVAEPTISVTQIREMIQKKVNESKQNAVVALLKEFGAANASSLLASNYDAFYERLNDL